MKDAEKLERMFTIREVAEGFGVTPKTVYKWIRAGDLGCLVIGRLRRVSQGHVRAFVKRCEQPPGKERPLWKASSSG